MALTRRVAATSVPHQKSSTDGEALAAEPHGPGVATAPLLDHVPTQRGAFPEAPEPQLQPVGTEEAPQRRTGRTGILVVALWVFSFWATSTEGYNLLQTSKIDNTAGRPTKTLITTLQGERRASLVYLGGRKHGLSAADLRQQRAHTDQVIAEWRRTAKDAPGSKIRRAVAATSAQLNNLPSLRAAISSGTITRDAAAKGFNTAIDAGFQIVSVNAELDDPDISADGRGPSSDARAD